MYNQFAWFSLVFAQYCWSSKSTVYSFPPTNLLLIVLLVPSLFKVVTVVPYKCIQHRFGLWIPDPILCQWNLDSGLQSLVVFRIRRAVFLIPKPGIPDSTNKIFSYPGYGFLKQKFPGFRISLKGAILDNFSFKFLQHSVNMGLVQLVKSRVGNRR